MSESMRFSWSRRVALAFVLACALMVSSPRPARADLFVSNTFSGNVTGAGLSSGRFLIFTPSAQVIPEPSTLAMLSIGVLGLFGYSWNRRRNPAG